MQAKRSAPGSPLSRPPSSTSCRYAISPAASASASGLWLYCGLRREPGKRRTSTSVFTFASLRRPTSSSSGRTPCPMVKTVTGIESRLHGREALVAGTVTWERLRQLASFRAEQGCAISLFLNLDPSEVPTAGDAQTRMNAMLGAAEKADRTDLTHDQRQALKADFRRIAQWFDDEFSRNGARGLAIFAAWLDNFWQPVPLPGPVSDRVKVGREFYLAPLIP